MSSHTALLAQVELSVGLCGYLSPPIKVTYLPPEICMYVLAQGKTLLSYHSTPSSHHQLHSPVWGIQCVAGGAAKRCGAVTVSPPYHHRCCFVLVTTVSGWSFFLFCMKYGLISPKDTFSLWASPSQMSSGEKSAVFLDADLWLSLGLVES